MCDLLYAREHTRPACRHARSRTHTPESSRPSLARALAYRMRNLANFNPKIVCAYTPCERECMLACRAHPHCRSEREGPTPMITIAHTHASAHAHGTHARFSVNSVCASARIFRPARHAPSTSSPRRPTKHSPRLRPQIRWHTHTTHQTHIARTMDG